MATVTLTALGFNVRIFNRDPLELFDIWEEEAAKRIEEIEAKGAINEQFERAGSQP